jgi:hypothetical protein
VGDLVRFRSDDDNAVPRNSGSLIVGTQDTTSRIAQIFLWKSFNLGSGALIRLRAYSLRIGLVLTKGNRGSIHIFNIGVSVNGERADLIPELEHFIVKKQDARSRSINWEIKDLKYMNFLSPGERSNRSSQGV